MGKPKKKQTREERLEKKRLAEQKRREKIRSNPQLYEEFKENDRNRFYIKKEQKKVLPLSEMTPRRQRIQRKRNRINFKNYYLRKKKKVLEEHLQQENDPESDNEILMSTPARPMTRNQTNIAILSSCSSIVSTLSSASTTSGSGKNNLRKYRYKKQKEIQCLQKQIKHLKRLKEAYRQKIMRLDKTGLSNIDKSRKKISPSQALVRASAENIMSDIRRDVAKFYEHDENSRLCPGKKETITRNKIKKQKRYLNDSRQNLHKKFLEKHGYAIHYSTFCKLRPFWVVTPKVTDRNTCQCKIHANMKLLINSLKRNKIVNESNSTQLLKSLCCMDDNITCLQRKCLACKNKVITYLEFDDSQNITYWLWQMKIKSFLKDGIQKRARVSEKVSVRTNPRTVIKEFEKLLPEFLKHCANDANQSSAKIYIKESLGTEECVIHIDYSENYSTKHASEIQSLHFGGSRQQITIHTAVIYYLDQEGKPKKQCFSTLSESLRHDAAAVWAHLVPLLRHIEKNAPQVNTIHIISDSPSSQYRNRKIFYIIPKLCWYFNGLKHVTWNYSESGHGKGAPDGVGATTKRTADQQVAYGSDITDIQSLFHHLKTTVPGIITEIVKEYDIEEKDFLIADNIPPFPGSMKVHQVVWNIISKNKLAMRTLSCVEPDCLYNSIMCQHGKHLGFYELESRELSRECDDIQELIQVEHSVSIHNDEPLEWTSPTTYEIKSKEFSSESENDQEVIRGVHSVLIHNSEPQEKSPRTAVNPNKQINILSDIVIKEADGEVYNIDFEDLIDAEAVSYDCLPVTGLHRSFAFTACSEYDVPEELRSDTECSLDPLEIAASFVTYKVGSWVIVKYYTKKQEKNFIGQILNVDNNLFSVRFVRKNKGSSNLFTFPDIVDEDTVHISSIVKSVNEPQINRRDQLIFQDDFEGLSIE